jgi:hypothetical protein
MHDDVPTNPPAPRPGVEIANSFTGFGKAVCECGALGLNEGVVPHAAKAVPAIKMATTTREVMREAEAGSSLARISPLCPASWASYSAIWATKAILGPPRFALSGAAMAREASIALQSCLAGATHWQNLLPRWINSLRRLPRWIATPIVEQGRPRQRGRVRVTEPEGCRTSSTLHCPFFGSS